MSSSRLTPHLCVDGVDAAIGFYGYVFGAREGARLRRPDGRVDHAVIDIGGAVVVLCDEDRRHGLRGPKAIGGTAVTLNVDVDDVDVVLARALSAGATPLRRMEDRQCHQRTGRFEDPFGHRWRIADRTTDVPAVGARLPEPSVRGAAAPPPP